MAATSAVIPPAAVAHRLRGEWSARRAGPLPAAGVAVLFDRDGTLVHDVPYNGDPALVDPVPGALAALTRLRAAGVPVGVVTNQSGIGRGTVGRDQVDRVNARVEELLGPFDTWQLCPHAPAAGCGCRKPEPGLVLAAASALGVPAARCVLIGDIGADVAAARAAGARAVLVPTPVTRPEEVRAAPAVAADLPSAVELALAMLGGRRMSRVLVARLDSDGDVLLAGPAVRAVAAAAEVVLLVGPRGRQAAALLPGVAETLVWRAPWIDPSPDPVDVSDVDGLVAEIQAARVSAAVVLTSFHQSALPLALLLRLAGVGHVAAVSEDYPGSLLDVRHRVAADLPEAGARSVHVAAAGFGAAAGRRRPAAGPRPAAAGGAPHRLRPVRGAAPGRVRAGPGLVAAPGRGRGRGADRRRPSGRGHRRPGRGGAHRRGGGRRHGPRRPDELRRAGRRAGRRGRRRGRQHRPGPPRRGGRHPGRLAVRAGRPGRPVGPVRGGQPCCSATSTRPAGGVGPRSARCPATPAWTR